MIRTLTRTLRNLVAILALVVLATAGTAAIAAAADTQTVVSPGLSTTGATATAPDGSGARTYSSTESASMMQPLLAAMYFGAPQFTDPSTTATRYVISFDYVFTNEDPPPTGSLRLNYAQQGSTGWVSFPLQNLWPGTAITSDMADKWFVISPAFVVGFNGQGTVQTFAVAESGTTTKSSSDVSSVLIIVVVVGAVVLIGGVFAITRRRRTKA